MIYRIVSMPTSATKLPLEVVASQLQNYTLIMKMSFYLQQMKVKIGIIGLGICLGVIVFVITRSKNPNEDQQKTKPTKSKNTKTSPELNTQNPEKQEEDFTL